MKIDDFIKKTILFASRYMVHDPVFVIMYGLTYFKKRYVLGVNFFNNQKLSKEIASGKSIIRIGDGEIGLLHGRDISYQKADKKLVQFLRSSIKKYDSFSPYILAIPVFINTPNEELKVKNIIRCWLPLKIEFGRIFNKKAFYGDAHFFYYKNNFENYLEPYLKTKKLILNTTKHNILEQKVRLEKVFNVLGWVEAQTPEPFELFEETKKQIDRLIEDYDGKKTDIVLVLSSGPMSKVLSYIYAQKGIQALDIGKGFEHIYNDNNFEHYI